MFTVTGIASFDYFFSIMIWFLIVCFPVCSALVLLTRKFL